MTDEKPKDKPEPMDCGSWACCERGLTNEAIAAIAVERERCAKLADDLANRWEASAMKCRTHTFTTGGWFSKLRTHVMPQYERMAKSLDDAAHGLRTVSRGIREGWTYK